MPRRKRGRARGSGSSSKKKMLSPAKDVADDDANDINEEFSPQNLSEDSDKESNDLKESDISSSSRQSLRKVQQSQPSAAKRKNDEDVKEAPIDEEPLPKSGLLNKLSTPTRSSKRLKILNDDSEIVFHDTDSLPLSEESPKSSSQIISIENEASEKETSEHSICSCDEPKLTMSDKDEESPLKEQMMEKGNELERIQHIDKFQRNDGEDRDGETKLEFLEEQNDSNEVIYVDEDESLNTAEIDNEEPVEGTSEKENGKESSDDPLDKPCPIQYTVIDSEPSNLGNTGDIFADDITNDSTISKSDDLVKDSSNSKGGDGDPYLNRFECISAAEPRCNSAASKSEDAACNSDNSRTDDPAPQGSMSLQQKENNMDDIAKYCSTSEKMFRSNEDEGDELIYEDSLGNFVADDDEKVNTNLIMKIRDGNLANKMSVGQMLADDLSSSIPIDADSNQVGESENVSNESTTANDVLDKTESALNRLKIPGLSFLVLRKGSKQKPLCIYCLLCTVDLHDMLIRKHLLNKAHLLEILKIEKIDLYMKYKNDGTISSKNLMKLVLDAETRLPKQNMQILHSLSSLRREYLIEKITELRYFAMRSFISQGDCSKISGLGNYMKSSEKEISKFIDFHNHPSDKEIGCKITNETKNILAVFERIAIVTTAGKELFHEDLATSDFFAHFVIDSIGPEQLKKLIEKRKCNLPSSTLWLHVLEVHTMLSFDDPSQPKEDFFETSLKNLMFDKNKRRRNICTFFTDVLILVNRTLAHKSPFFLLPPINFVLINCEELTIELKDEYKDSIPCAFFGTKACLKAFVDIYSSLCDSIIRLMIKSKILDDMHPIIQFLEDVKHQSIIDALDLKHSKSETVYRIKDLLNTRAKRLKSILQELQKGPPQFFETLAKTQSLSNNNGIPIIQIDDDEPEKEIVSFDHIVLVGSSPLVKKVSFLDETLSKASIWQVELPFEHSSLDANINGLDSKFERILFFLLIDASIIGRIEAYTGCSNEKCSPVINFNSVKNDHKEGTEQIVKSIRETIDKLSEHKDWRVLLLPLYPICALSLSIADRMLHPVLHAVCPTFYELADGSEAEWNAAIEEFNSAWDVRIKDSFKRSNMDYEKFCSFFKGCSPILEWKDPKLVAMKANSLSEKCWGDSFKEFLKESISPLLIAENDHRSSIQLDSSPICTTSSAAVVNARENSDEFSNKTISKLPSIIPPKHPLFKPGKKSAIESSNATQESNDRELLQSFYSLSTSIPKSERDRLNFKNVYLFGDKAVLNSLNLNYDVIKVPISLRGSSNSIFDNIVKVIKNMSSVVCFFIFDASVIGKIKPSNMVHCLKVTCHMPINACFLKHDNSPSNSDLDTSKLVYNKMDEINALVEKLSKTVPTLLLPLYPTIAVLGVEGSNIDHHIAHFIDERTAFFGFDSTEKWIEALMILKKTWNSMLVDNYRKYSSSSSIVDAFLKAKRNIYIVAENPTDVFELWNERDVWKNFVAIFLETLVKPNLSGKHLSHPTVQLQPLLGVPQVPSSESAPPSNTEPQQPSNQYPNYPSYVPPQPQLQRFQDCPQPVSSAPPYNAMMPFPGQHFMGPFPYQSAPMPPQIIPPSIAKFTEGIAKPKIVGPDIIVQLRDVSPLVPHEMLRAFADALESGILAMEKDNEVLIHFKVLSGAQLLIKKLHNLRIVDAIVKASIITEDMASGNTASGHDSYTDAIYNKIYLTHKHKIVESIMKKLDEVLDMASFKTEKCNGCTDLHRCMSYHNVGEIRRNPVQASYNALPCTSLKDPSGRPCILGVKCPLSHNQFEQKFHPSLFQKSICVTGSRCARRPFCQHAHKDTPEVMYLSSWKDCVVFGLWNSFIYLAGAIRGRCKLPQLKGTRVLFISSDQEVVSLAEASTRLIVRHHGGKILSLVSNSNYTISIAPFEVILGLPTKVCQYNQTLFNAHNKIAAIIVDNIAAILQLEDQKQALISIFEKVKKEQVNIVFVADKNDDPNICKITSLCLGLNLITGASDTKVNSLAPIFFPMNQSQPKVPPQKKKFPQTKVQEPKKLSLIKIGNIPTTTSRSGPENNDYSMVDTESSYSRKPNDKKLRTISPRRRSRSPQRSKSRSRSPRRSISPWRRRSRSPRRRSISRSPKRSKFSRKRSRSPRRRPKSPRRRSRSPKRRSRSPRRRSRSPRRRSRTPDRYKSSRTSRSPHERSQSPWFARKNSSSPESSPTPPTHTRANQKAFETFKTLKRKYGSPPPPPAHKILPTRSTSILKEFRAKEEDIKKEVEEEYKVFEEVPEIHPHFEKHYESFVNKYERDFYGVRNERHKEDAWLQYWKVSLNTVKAQELQEKLVNLRKEMRGNEEATSPTATLQRDMFSKQHSGSAPASSSYASENDDFTLAGTLDILQQLKDKMGMIGSALVVLIEDCRAKGITTPEALKVFADPEAEMITKIGIDKLKSSMSSASSIVKPIFVTACDWAEKLLEIAKNPPVPSMPNINIEAIAQGTIGKDSNQIVEFIKAAISYEGMNNPSKEEVNDLFLKVCSQHFKMAM